MTAITISSLHCISVINVLPLSYLQRYQLPRLPDYYRKMNWIKDRKARHTGDSDGRYIRGNPDADSGAGWYIVWTDTKFPRSTEKQDFVSVEEVDAAVDTLRDAQL